MNRFQLILATLMMAAPALAAQELPETIYELSDVETAPVVINAEALQAAMDSTYPAQRRGSGRGAVVAVAFVLGADGVPRHLRVADTTDEAFDAAAMAAISLLRFSPATVGGRPVAVHAEVPLEWPAREPTAPVVADSGAPPAAGVAAGVPETGSGGRDGSPRAADSASAARPDEGAVTGVSVGADGERVYSLGEVVANGRNTYELRDVTEPPRPRNVQRLREELERMYPTDLRRSATRGVVQLRFRVTAAGAVDSSSIVITAITDARFAEPTLQAIQVLRFSPARVDGRPVNVWVELPIQWEVDRGPAPAAGGDPRTPRR